MGLISWGDAASASGSGGEHIVVRDGSGALFGLGRQRAQKLLPGFRPEAALRRGCHQIAEFRQDVLVLPKAASGEHPIEDAAYLVGRLAAGDALAAALRVAEVLEMLEQIHQGGLLV